MMYFCLLLVLFIAICTAEAEKLSSGEDVKNFVERHIQGYEVCSFLGSLPMLPGYFLLLR